MRVIEETDELQLRQFNLAQQVEECVNPHQRGQVRVPSVKWEIPCCGFRCAHISSSDDCLHEFCPYSMDRSSSPSVSPWWETTATLTTSRLATTTEGMLWCMW